MFTEAYHSLLLCTLTIVALVIIACLVPVDLDLFSRSAGTIVLRM